MIDEKLKVEDIRRKVSSDAVYVVDKSKEHLARVTTKCTKCGSDKAFHWVSRISGEHAGIRRERTVEHFKCTKCSHSWTESS